MIVRPQPSQVYRTAAARSPRLAVVEPGVAVWHRFVDAHPAGHLLQLPAWGALKAGSGWHVQRVAVAAPAELSPVAALPDSQTLAAGAQLLVRRRYGLSVVYVPRGPLLAGDTAIDDLLLAAIQRVARRARAVFVRLEPNVLEDAPGSDHLHSWLLLHGFQPAAPLQPHSSVHVDLTPPPDKLFASFSKGHRADIRRAERQGVAVRVGGAAEMEAFYDILTATGQRAAFGIHERTYYRRAWQAFAPRSCLLLAYVAGEPVAGHMVFADARCGYYLYSGATAAGLKAGANHLLQWHALQWARDLGCTRYDFWGVPDALGQAARTSDEGARAALEAAAKADPLIGVYRFKKGFAGQVVRYLPAYDQVSIPPLYRLWQRRVA